jgi:hypothetical protein
LARHFVDYGYMFNAPGRIVVPGGHIEHEGEAPAPTTSPAPIESQQGKARPPAKKKRARKSNLGG